MRLRYRFVFLVFVAGVVALYGLGRLRFRSRGWALLVLSPRFAAEAFYNGRDVSFMALFTVAMLTLAMLARRPGPLGCGCRALSFPNLPWFG